MKDIIEFKGMNPSGSRKINYLSQFENIYVMDNHRLAAWCWVQHIDCLKDYCFLHIDHHYDTNSSGINEFKKRLNKTLFSQDIQSYIDFSFQIANKEYFISWDNYLPIFHMFYSQNISQYYLFVRENELMKPEIIKPIKELTSEYLLTKLDELDIEKEKKWIINIDLDYFFINLCKQYSTISISNMISNICVLINKLRSMQKLEVLTFALSPITCIENYGWGQSIDYLLRFEKALKLPIGKNLATECKIY